MIEITNHVTNFIYVVEGSSYAINKDMWDYAGILGAAAAPIIAIVFSIWNNHQIRQLKEEDRTREEEKHEKEEVRSHYQEINKFIDEKLWFLHESSEQEFVNTIITLQSMVSKLGMISRDKTRDQIIYYISAYIEVAYFLLTEKQNHKITSHLSCRFEAHFGHSISTTYQETYLHSHGLKGNVVYPNATSHLLAQQSSKQQLGLKCLFFHRGNISGYKQWKPLHNVATGTVELLKGISDVVNNRRGSSLTFLLRLLLLVQDVKVNTVF